MIGAIQPFWFWNGDMTEDNILYQMDEMLGQGIKGFIICPRQGLSIPYLSSTWFERVRYAVTEAKKRHMLVWIYDEQPYPSGISGGEVIRQYPECEAKRLRHFSFDIDSSTTFRQELPWGNPLFVKAFPIVTDEVKNTSKIHFDQGIDFKDNIGSLFSEELYHKTGLTPYNQERFLACNPVNELMIPSFEDTKQTYRLYIFIEETVNDHKYFGKFIDPLNPKSISAFIETTHERYKKYIGNEFGHTVKGFFTDETHPIGYEADEIPWSPLLPKLYYDRYGEDLLENMHKLVEQDTEYEKYRYQYMNTVVEGFITAYDKQLHDWCRKNNLMYIGEKPILRSSQLQHMDIPGIDAGHQKVHDQSELLSGRYRANGKIVASAGYFYEKEYVLCEAFHSTGWGLTLQDMKWTYDWLLLQGINMFVNHAYYYSTKGLRKHDAPPSSFYQMPWWHHQILLSDYMAKKTELITTSKRKIRLLIMDPVTTTWTCALPNVQSFKDQFEKIMKSLFGAGIDFYIIDQQLFATAIIKNGKIKIQRRKDTVEFDVVLLPNMTNIEDAAFKKLEILLAQKGSVAIIDSIPHEKIGDISTKRLENCFTNVRNCKNIFFGSIKNSLPWLKKLVSSIECYWCETNTTADIAESVYCIEQEKCDSLYYFLVNTGSNSGHMRVYKNSENTRSLIFDDSLLPYESKLFKPSIDRATKIVDSHKIDFSLDNGFEILGDNYLRMDRWYLSIDKASYKKEVHCQPIIDQLVEGEFSIFCQTNDLFGNSKTLLMPSLNAVYEYDLYIDDSFNLLEESKLEFIITEDSIHGTGTLFINHQPICKLNHHKVILPLKPYLVQGHNHITLELFLNCADDGLRDALYIQGDFNLLKQNKHYKISKSTVLKSSSTAPFYKGELCVKTSFDYYKSSQRSPHEIKLVLHDHTFVESCFITVNNQKLKPIAFSPYEWYIHSSQLLKTNNALNFYISTTLLNYYTNSDSSDEI